MVKKFLLGNLNHSNGALITELKFQAVANTGKYGYSQFISILPLNLMSCWHFSPQQAGNQELSPAPCQLPVQFYLSKGPSSQSVWHWRFLSWLGASKTVPWMGLPQGDVGRRRSPVILCWSQPTGHLVSSPAMHTAGLWKLSGFSIFFLIFANQMHQDSREHWLQCGGYIALSTGRTDA